MTTEKDKAAPEDPHPGYDCGGTCVIHSGMLTRLPAYMHLPQFPMNGTELECGGDELRPDGTCAQCERVNERIDAKIATRVKKAREEAFKIWHQADAKMPDRKEIIAIHKNCISIGDRREIELISSIDAWCTRDDLVKWALEAAAQGDSK